MIIFSSDNGPVLNDGYKDGAAEKVASINLPADCAGKVQSL